MATVKAPITDPTTGEWVAEYETRDANGEVSRRTEWFASEQDARRFARTGKVSREQEFPAESVARVIKELM